LIYQKIYVNINLIQHLAKTETNSVHIGYKFFRECAVGVSA